MISRQRDDVVQSKTVRDHRTGVRKGSRFGLNDVDDNPAEEMSEKEIEKTLASSENERKIKELRVGLKRRTAPRLIILLYIINFSFLLISGLIDLLLIVLQKDRNSNIRAGLDSIFRFNDRMSSIPRLGINTRKADLAVHKRISYSASSMKKITDRVFFIL